MNTIEATAVLGGVTGVLSLAVTGFKAVWDGRQTQALEKLVESQVKIAAGLDTELKTIRRELDGSAANGNPTKGEVELRKQALREREAEWRRTKDIMRGLGKILNAE